ncbi:MAG: NUDIX domain-containing protein [Bacteroidales bacterium]|nr:NUDIX domain-containing protein [Bacteroidales bacterium]
MFAGAGRQNRPKDTKKQEWLPVIQDDGQVIAMATREYCHSGSGVLHPVVHLHVLDRLGRIYLQKRSMNKKCQPGKWDTAVGGHIDYGETVQEALMRETQEELGFNRFNPIAIKNYVFEFGSDREMVFVFAAVGNAFPIRPNPEEIEEGRFWTPEEIDEAMGKGILTPNFEGEFNAIRKKLFALL